MYELTQHARNFTGPANKRSAWAFADNFQNVIGRVRPDHAIRVLSFFATKSWDDPLVFQAIVSRVLMQSGNYSLTEMTRVCQLLSQNDIVEEKLQREQLKMLG